MGELIENSTSFFHALGRGSQHRVLAGADDLHRCLEVMGEQESRAVDAEIDPGDPALEIQ